MMKKYFNAAIVYASLALAGGVFYREFTKYTAFTGKTNLAFLHTHYFMLGMFFFLALALLERAFAFSAQKGIKTWITLYHVGLNITTTFISLVFWAIIIGPLGPILAVPLTLFCKSVLFDADPRTRWLSVFMGGSLDNLVTGEEVPPVQAPAVVEDDEIEPDPDIEHRLDGKPEAPGAVVETEDEAEVAEDDGPS